MGNPHQITAGTLPPATGLMVFSRREGSIGHLLSGLSNADQGVRVESVKAVLLDYFQGIGKDISQAAKILNEIPAEQITRLTDAMVKLADEYHWQ